MFNRVNGIADNILRTLERMLINFIFDEMKNLFPDTSCYADLRDMINEEFAIVKDGILSGVIGVIKEVVVEFIINFKDIVADVRENGIGAVIQQFMEDVASGVSAVLIGIVKEAITNVVFRSITLVMEKDRV